MALFSFEQDLVVCVRALAASADGSALSEAEQDLAAAAGSEARRQEVLAGRLAAREALVSLGLTEPPAVLRAEDGRPRLVPASPYFVSLAHDGGFAAAAVAPRPLGLDVIASSRLDQATAVVQRRIATGRAAGLVQPLSAAWPAPLVLWSGWEAVGKLTGEGALSSAAARPLDVRPAGDGLEASSPGTRLRWWWSEGVLACVALAR